MDIIAGRSSALMWGLLAILLNAIVATGAWAAPGDTYRVTGERVNLRAGPSDEATVRSQVVQGDELIELTQQRRWLGVRVLRTGEEGWIYGDLVRRVAQSTIGRRTVSDAGFGKYAQDFDRLVEAIGTELGYPMVAKVDQAQNDTLRVTPTPEWLLNTGREAKLYAALALYQMWKNFNNGRPVNVAMLLNGTEFLTVNDSTTGPVMRFEQPQLAVR